jgi:undecaprenyl-diphosphatase
MSDFFEAIVWGLVQGLTEFLPISSSGHLVVVPGFLGMDAPSLETAAFLHMGTLAAVIVFYWPDLRWLLRFRSDTVARKVIGLLAIGSVPAAAGFFLRDSIAALFESNGAVGMALVLTGIVLWLSGLIPTGTGDVENSTFRQAALIGVAQAAALVPGISRSGMTITTGMGLGLSRTQAARFSFLLGIPAIFAAGLVEGAEALEGGGVSVATMVGVLVAGLSGYGAIKLLLRVLSRVGLRPFSYYCVAVGAAVLLFL